MALGKATWFSVSNSILYDELYPWMSTNELRKLNPQAERSRWRNREAKWQSLLLLSYYSCPRCKYYWNIQVWNSRSRQATPRAPNYGLFLLNIQIIAAAWPNTLALNCNLIFISTGTATSRATAIILPKRPFSINSGLTPSQLPIWPDILYLISPAYSGYLIGSMIY